MNIRDKLTLQKLEIALAKLVFDGRKEEANGLAPVVEALQSEKYEEAEQLWQAFSNKQLISN